MTGYEHTGCLSHPDLQRPRIAKDEADVNAFIDLMEKSWINPLGQDQSDIISLSTGVVVPSDVASDLLQAPTIGEEAYISFRRDRLENESPTIT